MIDMSYFAKEKGMRVTAFFVAVTDSSLDFTKKFIGKIVEEAAVDFFAKFAAAGVSVPVEKDIVTIIGRKRGLAVGKMSGRTSIRIKLKQLGIPLQVEDKIGLILEEVKKNPSKNMMF